MNFEDSVFTQFIGPVRNEVIAMNVWDSGNFFQMLMKGNHASEE
jgi:hypothetical protein